MLLGHNRKKMLGAECMADMLKGYGVTHVFHVPAVLRRSFVEMERRSDIKRLHVHGEKSAAYMADGYARASGKPGVCCLITGPGLMNAATPIGTLTSSKFGQSNALAGGPFSSAAANRKIELQAMFSF